MRGGSSLGSLISTLLLVGMRCRGEEVAEEGVVTEEGRESGGVEAEGAVAVVVEEREKEEEAKVDVMAVLEDELRVRNKRFAWLPITTLKGTSWSVPSSDLIHSLAPGSPLRV